MVKEDRQRMEGAAFTGSTRGCECCCWTKFKKLFLGPNSNVIRKSLRCKNLDEIEAGETKCSGGYRVQNGKKNEHEIKRNTL